MKPQNGVFVMLSFLAGSQVNFQLKGTCPQHNVPSIRLNSTLNKNYRTALHYTSEKEHLQIFGASEFLQGLKCVTMDVGLGLIVDLMDCEFYKGRLDWTEHQSYNLPLTNKGSRSKCPNKTITIENLNVWGDESNEFLIFWSFINDTKLTSHKQGVMVFVNSELVEHHVNFSVFPRLKKFTEEILNFTGLIVNDFDVNERLGEDTSTCDTSDCINKCLASEVFGGDGMSFVGPILLCAVILVCVIIICLVVFKFNLAFWFKFC